MSLTKWRKPHSITLPGGFRVPIIYWSDRRMKAAQRNDPTMAQKDLNGYWDGDKIVINADTPLWTQVRVLGHEMTHAVHDYEIFLEQKYADPIKQEAGETAMDMGDDE